MQGCRSWIERSVEIRDVLSQKSVSLNVLALHRCLFHYPGHAAPHVLGALPQPAMVPFRPCHGPFRKPIPASFHPCCSRATRISEVVSLGDPARQLILTSPPSSSKNAHRTITQEEASEVYSILAFSFVFGVEFTPSPTVPGMFWAIAGFLDIYVETPQLRMLWSSDKLDGWTIAYYCSVGVQIFFYVLGSIYGFVRDWYNTVELTSFRSTPLGFGNMMVSPIPSPSALQSAKGS